jgi:hypothetical protein
MYLAKSFALRQLAIVLSLLTLPQLPGNFVQVQPRSTFVKLTLMLRNFLNLLIAASFCVLAASFCVLAQKPTLTDLDNGQKQAAIDAQAASPEISS